MGGIGPRDPSKDSVFQTAYESGREYFRIRQEKQQRQFAEEEAANARFSAQEQHHPDSAAPSSSSSSSLAAAAVKIPIFKSLVLYFDGVQTGHHELRQLALSYGCSIRDFYTSSVTHIIADSMTLFKAEVWGKKAVRIVKPTWIHGIVGRESECERNNLHISFFSLH